MVNPAVIVAGIGGSIMTCIYVRGAFHVKSNWYKYRSFLYEVHMMNINALIGMTAFMLYALNIGIFGFPLQKVDDAIDKNCIDCVQNPSTSKKLLHAYVYTSIVRFSVWYAEAVVSLRFMSVYPKNVMFFIIIRYLLHTINFFLSIATFVVVSQEDFPMYELLVMRDDRKTHPYVTQLVVVFLVFITYASIAVSKPYKCPHVCICNKRLDIRTEWL